MTTPAPAAPAAAPVVPGKTLGIVGLILAFVAALIGAILGFVAKAQSKPAGFKNTPGDRRASSSASSSPSLDHPGVIVGDHPGVRRSASALCAA